MVPFLREKLGLTRDDALTLAGMSGGGLGAALLMHATNFPELREKMTSLLQNPGSVGVRGGLELSAWLSESKDRASRALGIASSLLRDMLTAKLEDPELPFMNADLLDGILATAHDRTEAQILAMSEAVSRAGELLDMETNINKSLVLDNLILKLIRQPVPTRGDEEVTGGLRRAQ
jgi:hypothetical protein